jgi:hypothetical protein
MWGDWENPMVKGKYWQARTLPPLRREALERTCSNRCSATSSTWWSSTSATAFEFASHPEISVKNAWSHDKLESELKEVP